MSLHLKKSNSIIFHIPKTGGTWVHRALEAAGVDFIPFHKYSPHNTYTQEPTLQGKFTIAFVRHPVSYYKSYWAYRMRTKWVSGWYLDDYCRSDNFEQFLLNVLEKKFPYVTWEFKRYGVFNPQIINFVGKQENLVEDLVWVLKFLNEKFDEEKLRKTPPQNVSNLKVSCSQEIIRKICELEKEVIKYFRYEDKDIRL